MAQQARHPAAAAHNGTYALPREGPEGAVAVEGVVAFDRAPFGSCGVEGVPGGGSQRWTPPVSDVAGGSGIPFWCTVGRASRLSMHG